MRIGDNARGTSLCLHVHIFDRRADNIKTNLWNILDCTFFQFWT